MALRLPDELEGEQDGLVVREGEPEVDVLRLGADVVRDEEAVDGDGVGDARLVGDVRSAAGGHLEAVVRRHEGEVLRQVRVGEGLHPAGELLLAFEGVLGAVEGVVEVAPTMT